MKFEDIVHECAYAVWLVYGHYCDEDLSGAGIEAVKSALRNAMPAQDSGIAYRESALPRYVDHVRYVDMPCCLQPAYELNRNGFNEEIEHESQSLTI